MRTLLATALLSLLGQLPAHAAEPSGAPMGNQPTCGQMIASKAVIPQKLAAGANALVEMFDAHAKLIGANKDKASQAEAKGLRELAKVHKQVATDYEKVANEMKKAASWPAAPHDEAKMKADPEMRNASDKVIATHKEIIAELQKAVAEMEKMHK